MARSTLFIFVVCFFWNTSGAHVVAQSPESWLEKAHALDKNGFWDEAVETWEKLATTNTNSKLAVYARLKLGTTYQKLGKFSI